MRIGRPKQRIGPEGSSVVEADVDGEPIWFASNDLALSASVEAFASALLVPAASRGDEVFIEEPLDRNWLQNATAVQQQLKSWWQLPGAKLFAFDRLEAARATPTLSAQCFTGGVDSYYELMTAVPSPNVLVFVHGYDIPRHDQRRLEAFLPGFRETATAWKAKPVLLTTNLREHPAMKNCSWEKSHGGALAAIGHLLSNNINNLRIPSSYPYHDSKPWGSHWDLDPFWSSSAVKIQHGDATFRRSGKVRAIANNPLVQRHLRVCHENNEPTGNCSRCEKCVRTMIAFANIGLLESCQAFDLRIPLPRRVDLLPTIHEHLISVMEEIRQDITDEELAGAVDRLIARSRSSLPGCRRRLAKWRERFLTRI